MVWQYTMPFKKTSRNAQFIVFNVLNLCVLPFSAWLDDNIIYVSAKLTVILVCLLLRIMYLTDYFETRFDI